MRNKGIQKIYQEVASSYELVNHVLTFGLDIHWRHKAVREAVKHAGSRWLDVCSGTGELAQKFAKAAGTHTSVSVYALDFSYPMLRRAKSKKGLANVKFTLADVSLLPFPDNTFDLIGISFATRNLNPSQEALLRYLKEFHRILKPGGVFINLETSQPRLKFIRRLFHLYVKIMVYPIGKLFSGSESGYRYLSYTIPRFYNSQDFTDLLKKTGFQTVREKKMFLGVAAIHKAFK